MFKAKIKLTLLALLFSFIFLGIGYLIASYISNQNNYNLKDVMFVEGRNHDDSPLPVIDLKQEV